MAKVITFSTKFPPYHSKAGKPTFFVERILKSLDKPYGNNLMGFDELKPKLHTIRSGNRFKIGDKFSPRIWSGKPYCSPQTIICEDLEIKRTYDFEMDSAGIYSINGEYLLGKEGSIIEKRLANNDGFDFRSDMFEWFSGSRGNIKPFKGQIICWVDVNY